MAEPVGRDARRRARDAEPRGREAEPWGRGTGREDRPKARRRLFFALGLDESCRTRLAESLSQSLGVSLNESLTGALTQARTVPPTGAATAPLAGLSGRAVAPADWHVTLCFLGAVEERLLAPLCAQAALIEASAFALHLTRVTYWRAAHVLAALAAPPPPAALQLADELRTRSRALGLAPDEKPLRPHVTLMRGVAPPHSRSAGGARGADDDRGADDAARAAPLDLALPATEFQLFESREPAARGATALESRYVSLARWPLRS